MLTSIKIGFFGGMTVLCVIAGITATPIYLLTAAMFFGWMVSAIVKSARLIEE